MPDIERSTDDPRLDWGPGEWFEETQRLEAEVERLRKRTTYLEGELRNALKRELRLRNDAS